MSPRRDKTFSNGEKPTTGFRKANFSTIRSQQVECQGNTKMDKRMVCVSSSLTRDQRVTTKHGKLPGQLPAFAAPVTNYSGAHQNQKTPLNRLWPQKVENAM